MSINYKLQLNELMHLGKKNEVDGQYPRKVSVLRLDDNELLMPEQQI